MKVLGTGSRDWPDTADGRAVILDALFALQRLALPTEDLVLIHGNQRGADLIMASIASDLRWTVRGYQVHHSLDGPWPAAGPRRNARMIREEHLPHDPITHAIAFPLPGSKGTWDCVNKAKAIGLVVDIRPYWLTT